MITHEQHTENLRIIESWRSDVDDNADDSSVTALNHALGKLLRLAADGGIVDAATVSSVAYEEQRAAEQYADVDYVRVPCSYTAQVLFDLARKMH
jgi:hypothetical protein